MPEKNVGRAGSGSANQSNQPAWQPSSAGQQQSATFRIIAAVLWLLAIGGELFVIFRLLRQNPVNMTLLIVAIIVIGVLAVLGDVLWKRANALNPASTSEPVRFFIQNQLGAIIGMIAFLPMIIMIFMNKNMSGQQKGIAGGLGIVVMLIAAVMGISFNPPSVEQYTATSAAMTSAVSGAMPASDQTVVPYATQPANQTASQQYASETSTVVGYTGQDLVFWKKDSTVYHLCQNVSALARTNATDNTIFSGTVDQAHAAGMTRLTDQVSEELRQCGFSAAATPTP